MKSSKPLWITGVVISLLVLLHACSGVLGTKGTVRIMVPGMGSASSVPLLVDSTTMTRGYVILGKNDRVYSFQEYENFDFSTTGEVFISNIETGEYLLGVILQNPDNIVTGLVLKNIPVEPGHNEFTFTVGPGIGRLKIGDEDFGGTPFSGNHEGYALSFEEDTIIIDYDRPTNQSVIVEYAPSGNGVFGIDNKESSVRLLDAHHNPVGDNLFNTIKNGVFILELNTNNTGFRVVLTENDTTRHTYDIILK